jgi:hypothetical protein
VLHLVETFAHQVDGDAQDRGAFLVDGRGVGLAVGQPPFG